MNQVIRKHISDNTETVVFEGCKTNCKKYITQQKKYWKQYYKVGKWCNEGIAITGLFYMEIR